jgi:GT2 family glycosyltransferase
MNAIHLAQVGLIDRRLFIWHDDTEHAIRLSQAGKIVCLPGAIVNHKVEDADYNQVTWKSFYGHRNFLHMLRRHHSRRYVVFKVLANLWRACRARDPRVRRLVWDATLAGLRGQLGIDPRYRPGAG